MNKEPTIGKYLDEDEEKFIKDFESGKLEFRSVLTPERKKEIEDMVSNTLNDEREKISLRISRTNLDRIKSRALQEGIPYQTLINSIIHKALTN